MEDGKEIDKQFEILYYIGIFIIGVLGILMCTGVFGLQVQQTFNEYMFRFIMFRNFF
ncbi:MAG: hypothetical protein ACTSYF_10765 [Promethearchaeota archaeon]